MLARVDWPAFMREIGMEIPQLMDLKSKEATGGAARANQGRHQVDVRRTPHPVIVV